MDMQQAICCCCGVRQGCFEVRKQTRFAEVVRAESGVGCTSRIERGQRLVWLGGMRQRALARHFLKARDMEPYPSCLHAAALLVAACPPGSAATASSCASCWWLPPGSISSGVLRMTWQASRQRQQAAPQQRFRGGDVKTEIGDLVGKLACLGYSLSMPETGACNALNVRQTDTQGFSSKTTAHV